MREERERRARGRESAGGERAGAREEGEKRRGRANELMMVEMDEDKRDTKKQRET